MLTNHPILYFNGVAVQIGDVVAVDLRGSDLDNHQAEVAVLNVDDELRLECLVPMSLLPFSDHYRMSFRSDEVQSVHVVTPGVEAIPKHSGTQQFSQGQAVTMLVEGIRYSGQIIAALEGKVAALVNDDMFCIGEAHHFNPTIVTTTLG